MRNALIIFRRELVDTLRNKAVLVQFVMFPVLALVMTRLVRIEGMPPNFFVTLFAAMYAGMAPLVAMCALVSEEKEENTLRTLVMSNVRPGEYLAGAGLYVWGACMIGSMALCLTGVWTVQERWCFLGVMAAGIAASTFLGAAIGTWCKSQMAATSVCVPVMLVLSFVPMIATFNDNVAKYSRFLYSEQISRMLSDLGSTTPALSGLLVLLANMAVAIALFAVAYRRSELA